MQALSQHLVVVAPARVTGNIRGITVVERREGIVHLLGVVHAYTDYSNGAGVKQLWMHAQVMVVGHIAHFAVKITRNPLLQMAFVGA